MFIRDSDFGNMNYFRLLVFQLIAIIAIIGVEVFYELGEVYKYIHLWL